MLQQGDEIDIWVVEKALGQGGMGSVYRCHNRSAQRILAAIKVLDPNLKQVASAKARFIREAEILFALNHPNIVKVRNVRMDAEPPYLEMEFVEGRSLDDVVLAGRMPLEKGLPLMRQGLEALSYLHERGIRHRDIKPGNLLVQANGQLKLVDFGIATEQEGASITESGQAFGSVSYAPPEWVEPDGLDPVAWDVYGLGVTFFELFTGRFAFPVGGLGTSRQKALQVMIAKQDHAPLDPGPDFPLDLRELIRDMTRSRIEDRIRTAEEALRLFDAADMEQVEPDFDFGDSEPAKTVPTWYPGMETGETMVPLAGAVDLEALDQARSREPQPVESPEQGPSDTAGDAVPATEGEPVPRDEQMVAPVVVGGLAVLVLGGIAAWWATRPEPEVEAPPPVTSTEVIIVVTSLPTEVPLELSVDGEPGSRDGLTFTYILAPGEHQLLAIIGEDCFSEVVEGGSPFRSTRPMAVWCHRTEETLDVEGETTTVALDLAPPTPTPLKVLVPGVEGGMARVGDSLVEIIDGEAVFEDLLPGRHELEVGAGTCTEEHRGCWPECPKGCASEVVSVDLPWEGELEVEAGIELEEARVPTPPPQSGGVAKPVTNAQFGTWLAGHPEWLPDAALEAGTAEGSYLKGWEGADPPAGKEGRAVVNVSWASANAYCASRGGLANIDASPQTWTEGLSSPWHEFREADGKPAWRRSDGNASTAVRYSETGTFIGFRCRR